MLYYVTRHIKTGPMTQYIYRILVRCLVSAQLSITAPQNIKIYQDSMLILSMRTYHGLIVHYLRN